MRSGAGVVRLEVGGAGEVLMLHNVVDVDFFGHKQWQKSFGFSGREMMGLTGSVDIGTPLIAADFGQPLCSGFFATAFLNEQRF